MLRRGDGDAACRRELHPLQLARPVNQPDRDIKVRLGKVGVFIGREDVLDARRIGLKPRQPGGEPFGEEFARDRDGVTVRRLSGLHRLNAFLEPQEPFAQGIEPGGAFGCEFEPFGGAAEQDDAEHVFQCADLLADRRRGHRQFVRRTGERQVARGGIEHAQGVEGEMGALHAG